MRAWKGEIYNKGQGNLEIGRKGDSAGKRTRICTPYFSGSWEREKKFKAENKFQNKPSKSTFFHCRKYKFSVNLANRRKGLRFCLLDIIHRVITNEYVPKVKIYYLKLVLYLNMKQAGVLSRQLMELLGKI